MHTGWLFAAVGLAFTFLGATPASAHLVNTNVGEFYAGMMHPLTGADHFLLALALALLASQCGKRAARVALLVFPLALLAGAAAGSRLPALSFLLPATQVLLVALGGLLSLSDRLGPMAVGVTALATGSILGYRSGMDMAASGVAAQFIPGVALTGLILVALVAAWVPAADSPAGRTLRGLAGGAFAVAGVVLIVGFLEPSARGTRLPNQEDLLAMLKAGELSAPLVAGILVTAFVWGAAHALTPGHGKAIVASYLIGSRSTPWHALYLGLTVTMTHTLGVFALGLVALFAARYVLPEQLYPWLAAVSGLIVAGLGATMFVNRLRQLHLGGGHSHGHEHGHSHGEHDDHGRDHHHQGKGQHHHNDPSHGHPHSHGESHHHHGTGADAHEPEHGHGLAGHQHPHLPLGADGTAVTWRSLLGLGISGGLMPCPSAVVLLLAAVSFNRTAMGMALVLSFSLGLACVLSAVGLLFVKGGRLIAGMPRTAPALRVLSVASAFFILGFGLWLTYDAVTKIRF